MNAFMHELRRQLVICRTAKSAEGGYAAYHIAGGMLAGAFALEHVNTCEYARLCGLAVDALLRGQAELREVVRAPQ